jgi:hypothetical protein
MMFLFPQLLRRVACLTAGSASFLRLMEGLFCCSTKLPSAPDAGACHSPTNAIRGWRALCGLHYAANGISYRQINNRMSTQMAFELAARRKKLAHQTT